MSRFDRTFGEAFKDLLGDYVASSIGPAWVRTEGTSFDERALRLRIVSSRDGVEYDVTVPWTNKWYEDVEKVPAKRLDTGGI